MSKKMVIKILTAFLMLAIFVPPFVLGGIWLKVLLGIIGLLVACEIAALEDRKFHPVIILLLFAYFLCCILLPADWFMILNCIAVPVLFSIKLFTDAIETDAIPYHFLLMFICGISLQTVQQIYGLEGPHFIAIYIGMASFMCDTAAYFFGVTFGKHKMSPKVSPNKTWEGAAGGYIAGLAASLIFGLLLIKAFPKNLIITASIILPFVSQIGDLSFSLIKRRFKIKDFSSIFPGHGGMLDRIDSFVFCLLVIRVLMIIWRII